MTAQIVRHRFNVRDYARMREAGILTEDDRVELIDGEVRAMSPIGPLHAAIVKRLHTMLGKLLPETIIMSVQDPIQLSDYGEPQPDIAMLAYREDFYAEAHPVAEDVLLVIEVADTSAAYDREQKLPRYAAALIPEMWLVDVNDLLVEQYTQPHHGSYLVKTLVDQSGTVTARTLPGLTIDVARIFG